jgi:hypothetical protein
MQRIAACGVAVFLAGIGPAQADCTCRARGVTATHGQTVCIPTPAGQRLATCGTISNVASWFFLDAPCPTANRESVTDGVTVATALPQSRRKIH